MDIKIELTKNKKQKPDYSNLPFGVYYTDHMFEWDYTEGIGWHDPRIVPFHNLEMSPCSMVLHYGQSTFEGLKAYLGKDGEIRLFRPEKNMERLNDSNERLVIPKFNVEDGVDAIKKLVEIDKDWIPTGEGTSLYIRPFIIATDVHIGVHPSKTYKFMIVLSPVTTKKASTLLEFMLKTNTAEPLKAVWALQRQQETMQQALLHRKLQKKEDIHRFFGLTVSKRNM